MVSESEVDLNGTGDFMRFIRWTACPEGAPRAYLRRQVDRLPLPPQDRAGIVQISDVEIYRSGSFDRPPPMSAVEIDRRLFPVRVCMGEREYLERNFQTACLL